MSFGQLTPQAGQMGWVQEIHPYALPAGLTDCTVIDVVRPTFGFRLGRT